MTIDRFIDGAVLGMLMASVFITVSMFSLFSVLKNRREKMMPVMEKFPPMTMAMGIVAVSYPTWAVAGGALSLLYRVILQQAPGAGLGSPNLAYTLVIVSTAVLLAAPLMILFRQMLAGVLTITLLFVGLFGWFLPYFAA
ncbi:MAG: hypothetical protein F4Y44_03055 [Chloroflexi bacterium]|nr:hypothetical protein [Chloroflexota bacterium]